MGDVLLIVHILAAATWLGAGVTVGFLTQRMRQAGDETGRAFMSAYERMGLLVFNPAGVLVLLSGVLLVIDGPVGIRRPLCGDRDRGRAHRRGVRRPGLRSLEQRGAGSPREPRPSPRLDGSTAGSVPSAIIDSTLIVLTIVVMVIKLGV